MPERATVYRCIQLYEYSWSEKSAEVIVVERRRTEREEVLESQLMSTAMRQKSMKVERIHKCTGESCGVRDA